VDGRRVQQPLDAHARHAPRIQRRPDERVAQQGVCILKQHWGLSFAEIAARPELDTPSVPLWDVMRFYERLGVTVRYGQVIRRVVPDLFGEIFLWCYLVCYRQHRTRPRRRPAPPAGGSADVEIAANIAALKSLIVRAQGLLRVLETRRGSR
jgi:hypothetical protein